VLKGEDCAGEVAARDTGIALLNQLLCGCDLLRVNVCKHRLVNRDLRQLTRVIGERRDNRYHRRRVVDLEQLTHGGRDQCEHHAAVVAQVGTIRPRIAVDRTIQRVDRISEMRFWYKRIVDRFLECLGAKASRDLSTLQASHITRFRDREAKALSRATANLSLKVLRVCFGEAVRRGLLAVNPAVRVPVLKSRDKSARRAFTLPEIKRILKACDDDAEWRGLVLFGLYLGQRLGDLAKLTWRAVNFETGEIAFTTRKTGRRIVLPLVQPLSDYMASLPASENPNAFIFPRPASATRTVTLSNQFRKFSLPLALSNRADTQRPAKAAHKRARQAKFRFTVCATAR